MDPTYTFDITSLVGILQRIAEFTHQLLIMDWLLIPSSRGLLFTFVSISNIFSQADIVVGFSSNANTNAITIVSGSL